MTTLEYGVGAHVPDDIVQLLRKVYGTDSVGKTGYQLAGHTVERRTSLEGAAGNVVASFQYGELLPEGAAKAFQRLGLSHTADSSTAGVEHAHAAGTVLELGMGTGMVAMQAFLQCNCLQGVTGIEVSEARCALGVAAANRLAAEKPEQYSVRHPEASGTSEVKCRCRILERDADPSLQLPLGSTVNAPDAGNVPKEDGKRWLEFLEGDLAHLTPDVMRDAKAIFLQVVLPESARNHAQRLLQHAQDGCRAFLLEDLSTSWALEHPSIFHALPDDSPGAADLYATSWNPRGHRFYVFEADRNREPTITADSAAWAMDIAAAEGHEL